MNKDAELKILAETIEKLGPDSYCGPWLESVLREVEIEMRNDLQVTPTLNETRLQCKVMLEEARAAAKETRWQADVDAATREGKARDAANRSYESARSALCAAQRALDGGAC